MWRKNSIKSKKINDRLSSYDEIKDDFNVIGSKIEDIKNNSSSDSKNG